MLDIKRKIAGGAAAIVLGALPVSASAQITSAADTAKLFAAIAKGCHTVPGASPGASPQISPSDLRAAFDDAYPIKFVWAEAPTRDRIIADIRAAGLMSGVGPVGTGPNSQNFYFIGRAVYGWAYDLSLAPGPSEGGIRILRRDGSKPLPSDFEAIVNTLFVGVPPRDAAGFIFECGTPSPASPTPDKKPKPTLTIAKAGNQLGKLKAEDQEAGEISVTDDRIKKSTIFATSIAAGVAFPITPRRPKSGTVAPVTLSGASVIPFVSYNREGADDPADDSYVNNLSFGIATNGYIGFTKAGWQLYYSANVRFETDDGFHSSAWLGEIDLQPILPLWGNSAPHRIVKIDRLTRVDFEWTTTAVADASSVTDPWQKKGLIKTPDYTRLGGNLTAKLTLRKFKGLYDADGQDWSVALGVTRSDRWNLGSVDGGAHLTSYKLSISPVKDFSLSFGYELGRELDSLAVKKQFKITVDIKR